jgi:hypothetical protein
MGDEPSMDEIRRDKQSFTEGGLSVAVDTRAENTVEIAVVRS